MDGHARASIAPTPWDRIHAVAAAFCNRDAPRRIDPAMTSTQRGITALLLFAGSACTTNGSEDDDGSSSSTADDDTAPVTEASADDDPTDATTPTSADDDGSEGTSSATTTADDGIETTSPGSSSEGADDSTTDDPNAPGLCAEACDGDPLVCCGMFGCDPQYPGENYDCVDSVCEFVGCESDEMCLIDGTFQLECHPFNGAGQCGGACEVEGEPCVVLSNAGTCIADDEGGVFCRNDAFACASDEDCQYSGGHCDLEKGTCFCLDDGECSTGICAK